MLQVEQMSDTSPYTDTIGLEPRSHQIANGKFFLSK